MLIIDIIIKYINKQNIDIEKIFFKWLKPAVKYNKLTIFMHNLLYIILDFHRLYPEMFSNKAFGKFIMFLKPLYCTFDIKILIYLIQAIQYLTMDDRLIILSELISFLPSLLTDSPIFPMFDETKYKEYPPLGFIQQVHEICSFVEFNSFHQEKPIGFTNTKMQISFPDDFRQKYNVFIKLLDTFDLNNLDINSFIALLLEKYLGKPKFLDVVYMILSISEHTLINMDLIFDFMIKSPLFSPKITIFTFGSENEVIHSLRNYAYNVFFNENITNIKKYIKDCKPFNVSLTNNDLRDTSLLQIFVEEGLDNLLRESKLESLSSHFGLN